MIGTDSFQFKKKNGEPHKYCFLKRPEDITRIENYSKAVLDTSQIWECHHRLETHYKKDGKWIEREVALSADKLIKDGKYYHVEPNELIFLTPSDHRSLHNTIKDPDTEKRRIDGCNRSWDENRRKQASDNNVMYREDVKLKHKEACMSRKSLSDRKVICVETHQVFEKISEAERKMNNGKVTGCISNVLRGKSKTAFGYHWKYYEPNDTKD